MFMVDISQLPYIFLVNATILADSNDVGKVFYLLLVMGFCGKYVTEQ